jgi:thioredoxin reductase (NADPH)
MLAALLMLRGEFSFEVEVLDVDADQTLLARYDEWVPVLLADDGEELCHYFIDELKVREYLGQFG